jgi:DNA-directed RNA polymerase subunit H (RpoH/RPB5)
VEGVELPVPEEEMIKKTVEKFEDDGYKIQRTDKELIGTTQDEKIIVKVVTGEKSIGVSEIRALIKRAEKEEVNETHLVSDSQLTPQAKKMVGEQDIRFLEMKHVLIDLHQHAFVPKHEILSAEDTDELLGKLKVQPDQLPKIRRSDPIIKLLGGKPGEIVRIRRHSPTAGTSIYYRLIIAA